MLRDGRSRRESRRLDADEVNCLRHIRIASDHKIRDTLAARWHELWPKAGVSKLQIAFLDLRQQCFCALCERGNRQSIFLVIVFSFHVRCRRPDENCPPERLREMDAEAKPVTVRQRINKILDQQRLWTSDFAIFSAHRINTPGLVS